MTLEITILGCGSSGGVPRPALGWGACDPDNPRNRRRRCSILVERKALDGGKTSVLVDTGPDLREQLLDAGVTALDAVLFTHEHADHTHGIDDLRPLFIHRRKRLDLYLDEPTSRALHARFGYCFMTPPGSEYPPIANEHRLVPGKSVTINGAGGPITAVPILLDHGDIPALGFRFDGAVYSPDLNDIPAQSLGFLSGLDLWIVDALRHTPHPSHFSLSETLAWIARLGPKRAILTNMHSDIDYATVQGGLPKHILAGFDGMKISA